MTTITFIDGTKFEAPLGLSTHPRRSPGWSSTDHIIGIDALGQLVGESEGLFYEATPCCGASDKGVEDGIVCRACYGPVPEEWGSVAIAPVVPRVGYDGPLPE